jgi:hypothetical protein
MADVLPSPVESAPVGPVAKTAVTLTAGTVALAIVDLISAAIESYGGALTPMTHDALLVLIMGVFGWFIHSQVLREDRAAFHQWVLSRFGYHPTASNPAPPPPPASVSPNAPQRSAAELLRQAGTRQ